MIMDDESAGFTSTGLKGPCSGSAGFLREIPERSEDDFPQNRLRPDLAQPTRTRSYLCLWEWALRI